MRPADKELASQLADQLSQAGFPVWNPAQEMGPGRQLGEGEGRALDESDVMVALITRGSLKSDGSCREIFSMRSRRSNFEHRLIPVLAGYVDV